MYWLTCSMGHHFTSISRYLSCPQQVTFCRLRLEHTFLTHSYLLSKNPPSVCSPPCSLHSTSGPSPTVHFIIIPGRLFVLLPSSMRYSIHTKMTLRDHRAEWVCVEDKLGYGLFWVSECMNCWERESEMIQISLFLDCVADLVTNPTSIANSSYLFSFLHGTSLSNSK